MKIVIIALLNFRNLNQKEINMYKNIFKRAFSVLVLLTFFVLTGCVSIQKPIDMDMSHWKENETKIAILVNQLPEPYTHKFGSQGLLDIAINNSMATGLTKHVSTLDLSDFYSIKNDLKEHIAEKNVQVVVLPEDFELPKLVKFEKKENFAKLDYRVLKQQLGTDQLLIINVNQLGTIRNYYGFMPIGAPKAIFSGVGELIDLSTNQILWHKPVNLEKVISGKWDEPKQYPNLTKAIFKVTEMGKKELFSPLKNR